MFRDSCCACGPLWVLCVGPLWMCSSGIVSFWPERRGRFAAWAWRVFSRGTEPRVIRIIRVIRVMRVIMVIRVIRVMRVIRVIRVFCRGPF